LIPRKIWAAELGGRNVVLRVRESPGTGKQTLRNTGLPLYLHINLTHYAKNYSWPVIGKLYVL
jgi:hypothetical protein